MLSATGPVLIKACPGAGKTRFALECTARLFAERVINRVLIVVPTTRLVEQWVQAGLGRCPVGLPSPLHPRNGVLPSHCSSAGLELSLHIMRSLPRPRCSRRSPQSVVSRRWVIFDEIHHAGAGSAWGIAAQQAFLAAATRILSLSGTPFRSKDPIVFIETRDGRPVANDTYPYGGALADGVQLAI